MAGENKADELASEFFAQQIAPLSVAADTLESPIEAMVFWALLIVAFERWRSMGVHGCHWVTYPLPGVAADAGVWWVRCGDGVGVFPQVEVAAGGKSYRIDIAIVSEGPGAEPPGPTAVYLAVELDGHDFHERTKEQAERDKAKDRALQSLGWQIARFTGAEVFRDPKATAGKVWDLVKDLARLRRGTTEAK